MEKPIDIKNMRPAKNSVIINNYSLSTGALYKNREVTKNPNNWHKFIIYQVQDFGRDFVLKTLLDHVQPNDLIPVYYTQEKSSVFFLARNCEMAIEKFCRDNLVVENPQDKTKPFKMNIILRFATINDIKVDISKTVTKILKKRYNTTTQTLNLDNFQHDPELTEYCGLSQPKLMSYVLHLARLMKMKNLILTNNEIRSLDPLEALYDQCISSIDLKNNLIKCITELNIVKRFKITDLYLEGNPLCDDYNEYTYVEKIKEYCPNIQRIDGIQLRHNGFPSFRRNFLCNTSGHDLVDQFLEYYFTSYDSNNRKMLNELYYKDALFSMIAEYVPNQISSSKSQMKCYLSHTRNLRSLADLSRSDLNLQQGNKAIIDFLSSLPQSEHDPYSFTVDLIFFDKNYAIILVGGIFKELPDSILDSERYLGFNRFFVLKSFNNEYCIVNEQFHIFNAYTVQQIKSFKHERPIRLQMLPGAKTIKQKQDLINTFKQITNLTTEMAKKYLEENHYDLKNAISYFLDLYKIDQIPTEGFQN